MVICFVDVCLSISILKSEHSFVCEILLFFSSNVLIFNYYGRYLGIIKIELIYSHLPNFYHFVKKFILQLFSTDF